MTEVAVLSARELHKSYREGALSVDVLRGAELDIAPAEIVAIVGASDRKEHAASRSGRP